MLDIPQLPEAPNQAHSFPLAQVRLLSGPFKERQDVHLRYLLSVNADRLLAPFRAQADLAPIATAYGGWEARDIRGHSLGHYLSALALMFAATGDESLRDRAVYIVSQLRECQDSNRDGYVLPVDKKAFEALHRGHIVASGFELNGVWVPYYTMHKVLAGLRDAYRYTDDDCALEIARNFCDWLHGTLSPLTAAQTQQMLTCEHGGMNEVLADLTADTGDERYLTMASRFFHHAKVLDPMLRGEDNLDGLHANTQIPKVVGLAREWEMTQEPAYQRAARSFWENVVHSRSFANGGHSENEHFFPVGQFPQKLTPHTCETCNTANLLKLTGHLFGWEPTAEQMDFFERALLNHLLVNIGQKEGEFGYFLNLGAVGVKVFSTPFDSWWCCVGTGLENPGRYAEFLYYHDEETLWINGFGASRLDWLDKNVVVTQETGFPESESTRLTFACRQPTTFGLKLRHPYWCEKLEIRLNGERVEMDSLPSSYVIIERVWQDGDTLDVTFPMRLRVESLPHSDRTICVPMFGPLVLAGIVPDEAGIESPASLRFSDHLQARGETDAFAPVFVAPSAGVIPAGFHPTDVFGEFQSRGVVQPQDLRFVPFYRIYEEQYAVYLSLLTQEEWARQGDSMRAQHELRTLRALITTDEVAPAYQQSEVQHAFESYCSTTGEWKGRKFRASQTEAGEAGWFSYRLAIDPVAQLDLVATIGSTTGREPVMGISVDGQTVNVSPSGDGLFAGVREEIYPLPLDLTRGKSAVTVRFESHPHANDACLFGLRIMKSQRTI